jgi:shikimate kinase
MTSDSSTGAGPLAVLIGSPGAGKTSVGRRVAQRLGIPFTDTDALIESEAGMAVADIFLNEGEEAFRRREAVAVAEALLSHEGILSLGGGAVLREETRERLQGHLVVWLRVSVADAASRVGLNTARPLLLGNVRGTLNTLLQERTPLYESVATDVVDTSGRPLREVVDDVAELLAPASSTSHGREVVE